MMETQTKNAVFSRQMQAKTRADTAFQFHVLDVYQFQFNDIRTA